MTICIPTAGCRWEEGGGGGGRRNEHKAWPFSGNVKGVHLNPKHNRRLHPGTGLIQTICHSPPFISAPVSEGVKALNVRFQFDSPLPVDGWTNPARVFLYFFVALKTCTLYRSPCFVFLFLLWRCIRSALWFLSVRRLIETVERWATRASSFFNFILACLWFHRSFFFDADPSRPPFFATVT